MFSTTVSCKIMPPLLMFFKQSYHCILMNPHKSSWCYAVLHWSNMAGESSPSMIFPAITSISFRDFPTMFDCQRVSLLSRFLVIPFHPIFKHLKAPFNHHSTTIQPPFNHHSTTIQQPFNHHSTTIQPPFNHHSTTIQPPLNNHSTTIQPPFNHHSTTIQPHRAGAIPIEPAVSVWYPHWFFFEPSSAPGGPEASACWVWAS